ncbi:hypothetical protein [Brachybacterium sp. UNK5269]|uniref:hypothetical protein n=1 Tax=Brachybacterium sp. UNK5269 TaxID=3408576 RepID=UPI003BAF0B2D
MMLKLLTIVGIVLLLLLRLLRGRFGAGLLGVSVRVISAVYLSALLIAGVLAVVFEQWILLTVVVILLALSAVEEIRRRAGIRARDRAARSPRSTA